jgi:hypothetical protein
MDKDTFELVLQWANPQLLMSPGGAVIILFLLLLGLCGFCWALFHKADKTTDRVFQMFQMEIDECNKRHGKLSDRIHELQQNLIGILNGSLTSVK